VRELINEISDPTTDFATIVPRAGQHSSSKREMKFSNTVALVNISPSASNAGLEQGGTGSAGGDDMSYQNWKDTTSCRVAKDNFELSNLERTKTGPRWESVSG
jgi:hypothetical protein